MRDGKEMVRGEDLARDGSRVSRQTCYEVSIPPVGSGCAGNNSLPHMDQAAAAVTMPPKAGEWMISSVAIYLG